jgi:hypothetical protein
MQPHLIECDAGGETAVVVDGQAAQVHGPERVEQGHLRLTHPNLEKGTMLYNDPHTRANVLMNIFGDFDNFSGVLFSATLTILAVIVLFDFLGLPQ